MPRVSRQGLFGLVCLVLLAGSVVRAEGEHPLLGRWIGLDGESKDVVVTFEEGFLSYGETRVPCRVVDPGALSVGAPAERIEFEIRADVLTLKKGGESVTFRRLGPPPTPPIPTTPVAGTEPEDLPGVDAGDATRYEHPRGWFGFDMPKGWSVYGQDDFGMIVNPGLTSAEDIPAIVGLLWGRLQPEDENRPVAELIAKQVPALREALKQQGIVVSEPDGPIRTYKGKDVPGAVVAFAGHAGDGKPCRVWCGGIVKRDSWILISGVFAAGKEAEYLPRVKRIFVSLEPRPPVRNEKLEAALVGRTFSSSVYGRVTKSAHHASYAFAAGHTVSRRLMSNIIGQPGLPGSSVDAERVGRYEVCGDVLYLFFDDGQSVGQVLVEGDRVVGFRIGTRQYR